MWRAQLAPRALDGGLDEHRLGSRVAISIVAERDREALLELVVLCNHLRVAAQEVSKKNVPMPKRRRTFDGMEMKSPGALLRRGEEPALGEFRLVAPDVLVVSRFEIGDAALNLGQMIDTEHHVDHGLGPQPRNGSAADVFNLDRDGAEDLEKNVLLGLEPSRPRRVVWRDLNWRDVRHALAEA